MVGRQEVTIRHVAAAAGVSTGTVSNTLNHPDSVSTATRRRVLAAADTLGFVRNAGAASLRMQVRTTTIGLVVLDAANPFFAELARGAEDAAHHVDRLVAICSSEDDPVRERKYYAALESQRVTGIIVSPAADDYQSLLELQRRGVAVVLLERHDPAFCSVAVDSVTGGQAAVTHLLGLGHRNIAFVSPELRIPQYRDRHRGAEQAISNVAGAKLEEIRVPRLDGARAGRASVDMLLNDHPDVTGVFCANDLLALGLMAEYTRRGHHIPEDLSVVGFDDIDAAWHGVVPLTTVRQPARELGRRAAEMLMEESDFRRGHVHQQVIFRTELVQRSSTSRCR